MTLGIDVESLEFDYDSDVVADADMIVTVTTSQIPLFDGNKLKKGALVVGVGSYQPHTRETDSNCV